MANFTPTKSFCMKALVIDRKLIQKKRDSVRSFDNIEMIHPLNLPIERMAAIFLRQILHLR